MHLEIANTSSIKMVKIQEIKILKLFQKKAFTIFKRSFVNETFFFVYNIL